MACAWFVFVSVFSILSAATCRAKTADEAELEAERGVDGASGSATGVIPAGMVSSFHYVAGFSSDLFYSADRSPDMLT